MLGIIYIRFLQIQIHLYQSRRMKEKAMENVTTHACQSRLESFRIQVIPGKVPNWIWLLSKLKAVPFGVNLPKSFIWSDPKFTEVNGKTPAAFRLNWIRPLLSTMEPLFCCLGAPLQAASHRISPSSQTPFSLWNETAGRQQTLASACSCSSALIFQAVSQALMPVDKSQSYFNTGNIWRHFASIFAVQHCRFRLFSPHASELIQT